MTFYFTYRLRRTFNKMIKQFIITLFIAISIKASLIRTENKGLKIKNTLKNSIENFTTNYSSNKCIVDIFNQLEVSCDVFTDINKAELAYQMTKCLYTKLSRSIGFECDSDNYQCTKYLSGDSWNTFLSFTNQIDNTCFYYKILQWENSIEQTFVYLQSNTQQVISAMEQSKLNTKELLEYQQLLASEAKDYHNKTISELESVMKLSQHYKEFENNLKSSMEDISEKLSVSDKQINQLYGFIENKISIISSIHDFLINNSKYSSNSYFYYYLFVTASLSCFSSHFYGIRSILFFEVLVFYFTECYLVNWLDRNFNFIDLSFIGINSNFMYDILRMIFSVIFIFTLLVKIFVCGKTNRKNRLSRVPYNNTTSNKSTYDIISNDNDKSNSNIKGMNKNSGSMNYDGKCTYNNQQFLLAKNSNANSHTAIKAFEKLDDRVSSIINEMKTNIVNTPIWMKKFVSKFTDDIKSKFTQINLSLDNIEKDSYSQSNDCSANNNKGNSRDRSNFNSAIISDFNCSTNNNKKQLDQYNKSCVIKLTNKNSNIKTNTRYACPNSQYNSLYSEENDYYRANQNNTSIHKELLGDSKKKIDHAILPILTNKKDHTEDTNNFSKKSFCSNLN